MKLKKILCLFALVCATAYGIALFPNAGVTTLDTTGVTLAVVGNNGSALATKPVVGATVYGNTTNTTDILLVANGVVFWRIIGGGAHNFPMERGFTFDLANITAKAADSSQTPSCSILFWEEKR